MTRDFDAVFFRELEESLLRPEVRRSSDELDRLLASDFTEFGSSGAVSGKDDVIEALAEETPIQRALEDFRAERLAPDVALVTYRSRRGTGGAERHFLRSAIWRLDDEMVFHQGAPTRAR